MQQRYILQSNVKFVLTLLLQTYNIHLLFNNHLRQYVSGTNLIVFGCFFLQAFACQQLTACLGLRFSVHEVWGTQIMTLSFDDTLIQTKQCCTVSHCATCYNGFVSPPFRFLLCVAFKWINKDQCFQANATFSSKICCKKCSTAPKTSFSILLGPLRKWFRVLFESTGKVFRLWNAHRTE